MTDIFKEIDIPIETLSVYKVLEGLIHNINTPLNIIIGYSQQLKKQHPEIDYLESITEAGLQIDDLVQVCSRQLAGRFVTEESNFELKKWLSDELKLLRNVLEVKHTLHLDTIFPDEPVFVTSNPFLLGLVLESVVLFISKSPDLSTGNNTISFALSISENTLSLNLLLPASHYLKENLALYLSKLQKEMEFFFGAQLKAGFPFQMNFNNNNEVKISLSIQETE